MERISREGLGSMAERMRAAEAEATRLRGALAQAEAKGGGSSGEAKFNGRCVRPIRSRRQLLTTRRVAALPSSRRQLSSTALHVLHTLQLSSMVVAAAPLWRVLAPF